MKLLHLDASILGDHSVSRQLTREVVESIRLAETSTEVVYRDLASNAAAPLDGALLAAKNTPAEARTPEQAALVQNAEAVMNEFLSADTLVIGAPMYNFTVPTQLKAWIDRVAVAGKTFRYTEAGPEGLCGNKKVVLVSTAGGLHAGQPSGAGHEDFLKVFLGFIGVTDLEIVRAHGLAYGPEHRTQAIDAAQAQIANALFAAA